MMFNVKLTPYWRHFQVSMMSSSFHNGIEAVKKEAFEINWLEHFPFNFKEEIVRLKSSLPQENKDDIDPHTLLSKAKAEAEKVRLRVNNYTKDHISILDKETCSLQLNKIDECNLSFQDWVVNSTSNLDGSIPAQLETLNELKKVSDELNLCVKQNAVEVKAKLVKLLQEDEEKKAISSFERESLDLKRKKLERLMMMDKRNAAQLKEKIPKRMENVSHEVENLRS